MDMMNQLRDFSSSFKKDLYFYLISPEKRASLAKLGIKRKSKRITDRTVYTQSENSRYRRRLTNQKMEIMPRWEYLTDPEEKTRTADQHEKKIKELSAIPTRPWYEKEDLSTWDDVKLADALLVLTLIAEGDKETKELIDNCEYKQPREYEEGAKSWGGYTRKENHGKHTRLLRSSRI